MSHRFPCRQPGAQMALAGTRGTTWRPGRWSGQLQLQLAAISGSLAGGVSGAGEQTPVGVTQAVGYGWGCAQGVAEVHMATGKGYECK